MIVNTRAVIKRNLRRSPKGKNLKAREWTAAKSDKYKTLMQTLEEGGFVVRREELKRGHGWKTVSGVCKTKESKFVFVDSRLSPDEQIAFLQGRLEGVS